MLGEVDFVYHVGNVIVSKTDYLPNAYMPRHTHDLPYIAIVLEGSYTKVRTHEVHGLSRSMVAFHPAGEVHADCIHDSRASTLNFEFRAGTLPVEFSAFHGVTVERLCEDVLDALFGRGANAGLRIQALVDYVGAASARAGNVDRSLTEADEWMRNLDRPGSVSALANKLGVHRAHLHRAFRKAYGRSPRERRALARADAAAKLLATSRCLTDIALESGYYDHSQFCRQFKNVVGMTPSAFRARFFPGSEATSVQDPRSSCMR